MKPLIKSIRICLESILDVDDIFLNPENDKKVIENWIRDNYKIRGNLTISGDFVANCTGFVEVKNKSITSLTNGMFRWGEVNRNFSCHHCDKLISLEGAPKKVGDSFSCSGCSNLTSLEGAPEKVGGQFWCEYCTNLKSLEGAPEKIGDSFSCSSCEKLTSLEGAPKEVRGSFWCEYCNDLTSLKGTPEKVSGYFYCEGCPNLKITDSERKKYKIED